MWKFSFLRKTFLSYAKHSYFKNFFQLVQGVIHKVRPLRFCNLDSPPPPHPTYTSTYAFNIQSLFPSTSVRILFFKVHMTDIFCELLSIEEPQTTLQNKGSIIIQCIRTLKRYLHNHIYLFYSVQLCTLILSLTTNSENPTICYNEFYF